MREKRYVSPFAIQAIYDYLKTTDSTVKARDIAEHFCTSYSHVLLALKVLIRLGAIRREGWGRDVVYRIWDQFNFSVADFSVDDFWY